jgi:opacity protein-like surface antigen
MSGTSSIRQRATLVLGALAVMSMASLAGSQVPNKPPPKDTTVKQQAKPKVAAKKAAPKAEQKHIKILKEKTSGGEVSFPIVQQAKPCDVLPPPIDEDAIRNEQYRLDSIAAAMERERLTRESDMAVARAQWEAKRETALKEEAAALALKRHLARGFYFGAAGGTNSPQRSTRDGYTGGYDITVPVGFDVTDLPFGVRVDFSVDHFNGTRIENEFAQLTAASGDITVWSLSTDLKLRMNAPGSTRTHLYALGGIGAHRVTGGVYGISGPNAGTNLDFSNAGTKFGWNAGVGASFSWGPADLFVESRFFQVKTDMPYHTAGGLGTYTSFTPVVIGLQWF